MIEGKTIEWFDDLALGIHFKSGEVGVAKQDITRFAAEFDPQPFHLDPIAAEKTVFKGLAASGWHTAAISMGLAVQVRPFGPHPLLGLRVDDLRWMMPVRSAAKRCILSRRSGSSPAVLIHPPDLPNYRALSRVAFVSVTGATV